MTEQEAIVRLKSGDISGLEGLVRLYQVQAVRAAYLIIGDRAAAEDIVQSAFLTAYERIAQFDARRPFGPWFLRSVANLAIKTAHRRRRFVAFGDEETDPGNVLLAPDLIDSVETRQAVWTALQCLSPEQRAAIILHYYLDLSEEDIAQRLATPRGTIKWRLHEARRRLRMLLRLFKGDEENVI
jgi:RNA polymerase sigma-70 factor (ECF subfamily)